MDNTEKPILRSQLITELRYALSQLESSKSEDENVEFEILGDNYEYTQEDLNRESLFA